MKIGDMVSINPLKEKMKTITPDVNTGIIIDLTEEKIKIYWLFGFRGSGYVGEYYKKPQRGQMTYAIESKLQVVSKNET